MAFPVWCELVCRTCADTTAGRHTFGIVPRQRMKKEAEDRDWALIDNEWYCRTCKVTAAILSVKAQRDQSR